MPGQLRFPRSARVLAKADFDSVFRNGSRLGGRYLRLFVIFAPEQPARLGVALAKRQVPLSVTRNRIRRQLRENFRLRQAELAGRCLVFAAKSEAATALSTALRTEIQQLLSRAAALPLPRPAGTMPG